MAWADWQINGALGGMKAIGTFVQQSRQAASDKLWQKYNNALTNMQNAQNQNNITINQNIATEKMVRDKFNVEVAGYQTQASAEVASAAVGAEGNSVDLVMEDIKRNQAAAGDRITREYETGQLVMQEQKRSSNLQTAMQLDYQQIPSPNIASSLLSWGADTASKWWESKTKTS